MSVSDCGTCPTESSNLPCVHSNYSHGAILEFNNFNQEGVGQDAEDSTVQESNVTVRSPLISKVGEDSSPGKETQYQEDMSVEFAFVIYSCFGLIICVLLLSMGVVFAMLGGLLLCIFALLGIAAVLGGTYFGALHRHLPVVHPRVLGLVLSWGLLVGLVGGCVGGMFLAEWHDRHNDNSYYHVSATDDPALMTAPSYIHFWPQVRVSGVFNGEAQFSTGHKWCVAPLVNADSPLEASEVTAAYWVVEQVDATRPCPELHSCSASDCYGTVVADEEAKAAIMQVAQEHGLRCHDRALTMRWTAVGDSDQDELWLAGWITVGVSLGVYLLPAMLLLLFSAGTWCTVCIGGGGGKNDRPLDNQSIDGDYDEPTYLLSVGQSGENSFASLASVSSNV